MPSQQAPNVGLNHSWDLGESGWNLQMDENLRALDALLFLTVASMSVDVPATPAAGDRYIVPGAATGAWAGQDGKVARYDGTAWEFYLPKNGWVAFVVDLNVHKKFNGSLWGDSVSTTGAENKGLTGGGGTGVGVFLSKVGATLGFKSLVAGTDVAFDTTTDPNQIIINASASGGTGGISDAPNDGNAYVRKALGWVRGITRSGDRIINLRETRQTVTDGNIDASLGGIVEMTLTANTVLNITNLDDVQSLVIHMHGTDLYSVDWSTNHAISWHGGVPLLTADHTVMIEKKATGEYGYDGGGIS
ncbi:MAG: DUF2793 domain-containing protein [Halomonas sp.]|nr:DUF2793 domain-containing protein [Halomonas sp.]